MANEDSIGKRINLLIAEIDDGEGSTDPRSVSRFLEERKVATSVASAVRRHFCDAANLRRHLRDIPSNSLAIERAQASIGPYRLIKKLGEGGMGSVWLAEQSEPIRRQVALKLMRPGLDSDQFLRRFETERQAQAIMDHPHVAKVLDAGATSHGAPFFVMEYLPGKILTSYCQSKKLDIARRLRLFLDLCQAIQHAHQKGIIHRDIKPSNVIVCEIDSKPVVKVIDFGLARAIDTHDLQPDAMTQFGTVVGSLPYMSPEQARGTRGNRPGEDIDTRTDVYSLGAVLFELLTGTTPIPAQQIRKNGVVDTLRAIQEDDPPRPSVRLQSLTRERAEKSVGFDQKSMRQLVGDLDWIVMRALEINRDRRYDAVSGLSHDVERFLEDEPVSARPPSRTYLMQKFVHKHRFAVASSLMVVSALVVGLVVAAWQFNRARIANLELTRKNAALADANQLEKSLRSEASERQIEYLVRRGQWSDAEREISRVRTENNGQISQRVQLANLAVLDGLQHTQEFKRALKQTETQNWSRGLSAERNLWRGYGYLLDGEIETDPANLIEQSLQEGTLSIADTEFARGLLADSLAESVDRYKKALAESSFHLRARLQLVITLVLMGKRDEAAREAQAAIQFFPDDLRFHHAFALSAAFDADRQSTLQAIETARDRFPNVSTNYIMSALRISEEFQNTLSSVEQASPFGWVKLAASLQSISLSQLDAVSIQEFYRPQVLEAFSKFVRAQTSPASLFKNKFELMMESASRSYAIHPDALFLHMEAMAMYSVGNFEEAEANFANAIEGFSLFPAVTNEARFFAFASRASQFVKSQNEEDLQKAVDYLNEYEVSRLTGSRFDLAFRALARVGRWEKAKELLNVRIRQTGDQRGLLMLKAGLAAKYGHTGIALQTYNELLAAFPDDAAVIKSRAELIERISANINEPDNSPVD